MQATRIFQITRDASRAWLANYAPSMGAAIAYYTIFSIAPLLLIVITVFGSLFGPQAVQAQLLSEVQSLIGAKGATAIGNLLSSVNQPHSDWAATTLSALALLYGATSVFSELQNSLERIWHLPKPPEESSLWRGLRKRLISFGLIAALGFLLTVSLAMSAAMAALAKWAQGDGVEWNALLQTLNFAFGFGLTTAVFALVFKVMPRAQIAWRDVWLGAAVTAALFNTGRFILGFYIVHGHSAFRLTATGSLLIILLWVYFSAQLFLFGAEFTYAFARAHGHGAGHPESELQILQDDTVGDASRAVFQPNRHVYKSGSV